MSCSAPAEIEQIAISSDSLHGIINTIPITMAERLMMQFGGPENDVRIGMVNAVRAIASYRPETEADYISAGQVVSMSMTSMNLLRTAEETKLSPEMRLRFVREAKSLALAACRIEKAMEDRRKQRARAAQAIAEAVAADPNGPASEAAAPRSSAEEATPPPLQEARVEPAPAALPAAAADQPQSPPGRAAPPPAASLTPGARPAMPHAPTAPSARFPEPTATPSAARSPSAIRTAPPSPSLVPNTMPALRYRPDQDPGAPCSGTAPMPAQDHQHQQRQAAAPFHTG